MTSPSRMAEAAFAARAVVKAIDFDKLGADDRREDKLRDAVAAPNDQRLGAKIDYDNADFATVIGVDGAGRINQRQPFTQRATAARTHLALKPRRYLERNSSRYRGTLQRLQFSFAFNVRHQVKPGGVIAMVVRKRQFFRAKTLNLDRRHYHSMSESLSTPR